MADNSLSIRSHSFQPNKYRNQDNPTRDYDTKRYNGRCTCFVQKFNKSIQTDDLKFVNIDNSINGINELELNRNDDDSSTSYKTCPSSRSSVETIPTRDNSNKKQTLNTTTLPRNYSNNTINVLPQSTYTNGTHVDQSTGDLQQTKNDRVAIKENRTNRKSRSPIFIPAGHNPQMPKYIKNVEKRHENIMIETQTCNNQTKIIADTNKTKSIDSGCDCPNYCENWYVCTNWKDNNLNFGDVNSNVSKKFLFLDESNLSNNTEINKIVEQNLLIHGRYIPKPADLKIINNDIRSVVANRDIDVMAKYSWTIIARRLNLLIIDQKQKYFDYLPSICSSICESRFYQDLSQFVGPLMIILTPCQEISMKIYGEIQYLLKETWDLPQIQVVTDKTKDIKSCDVVIIDSRNLLESLQKSKLSLKRCCHLIIDSLDIQICSQADLLGKFLKILNEMLSKRPVNKTLQFIATSNMWMHNFEVFLKHLHSPPVVILNDCLLDITVYSKINFIRKILKAVHRKFYLSDTIRKHYETKRILIFCQSNEEIADIAQYLDDLGIGNFKLNANDEEIHHYERSYQKLTSGCYKVLICSDSSYKKLQNIKNIDWLINYGFSRNWNDFIDRFKCMLETFTSPLQNIPENNRCSCYFVIDEADENGIAMYHNLMEMYSKRRVIDKLKF